MSDKKTPTERTFHVKALARVEGEGTFHVTLRDGRVEEARLDIFEPPRFFEAFLRGRDYREVPDITARICGICPVAYQMGSCHAIERAIGVFEQIDEPIRRLRDLLYCGEWIESHVLHMFMLHLPDFLGYESVISMAENHADLVRKALRIKKVGNDLVALLGGRAVHPVGACIGGFHAAPDPEVVEVLLPRVREALSSMKELTLFLAASVRYPFLERDYEFVALCPDTGYPMNLGRIRSNKGLDVDQSEFGDAIEEIHVAHSTALQSVIRGRGAYVTGPLARLNLNASGLHPHAGELLPDVCRALGHDLPWKNSYFSLPARAIETVHALALALDVLEGIRPLERTCVPVSARAGVGGHGTEAPRGLCWHQYETTDEGTIARARICPPTAQNQLAIEEDLAELALTLIDIPDEEATLRCEHLIRNYDPCISCSVHFLKLDRRIL